MKNSNGSRIIAANLEMITRGKVENIARFFAPDYLVHLTGQDLAAGHHGIRQSLAILRAAFPDLLCEVEILAEDRERVAWIRTFRGLQQGKFKGFPASGKEIAWREMVTSRLENGLIAEEWLVSDLAERLLLSRKK